MDMEHGIEGSAEGQGFVVRPCSIGKMMFIQRRSISRNLVCGIIVRQELIDNPGEHDPHTSRICLALSKQTEIPCITGKLCRY